MSTLRERVDRLREVFKTHAVFRTSCAEIRVLGRGQVARASRRTEVGADLTHPAVGAGPQFTFSGVVTINGPGTLTNEGELTLTSETVNAPLVNHNLVVVRPSVSTLGRALTNEASGTIRIAGVNGSATLTVVDGFANEGTIELTNFQTGWSSTLSVSNGVLVNLNTITVLTGEGSGSRTLDAEIDNQGTIDVLFALSIDKGSATHVSSGDMNVVGGDLTLSQSGTTPSFTSSGGITIDDGRTFTISGGSFENTGAGAIEGFGTLDVSTTAFVQDGTANPGSSPGLLSVTGPFPEGPTAIVNSELGGLVAGDDYDVLAVSEIATLNGTLNVSLIDGFTPLLDDSFEIVTYSSRVGKFVTINGLDIGGGLVLEPTYGPTSLTLTVVQP